ncbi:hypothetical protein [Microbacterium sp.]|uniref:hypothetical protein n=1 Tax=Microbacterium sp. TaxID=51671 RepID=UPI0039E3A976
MDEIYDPRLAAHVERDDAGRVRSIRHSQEHWVSEEGGAVEAAIAYVRALSADFEAPPGELAQLHVPATHLDPRPAPVEYRLGRVVPAFDATTVGFDQTIANTPVWQAGLAVTVKSGPNRVVAAQNTSHDDVEVHLPSREVIDRYLAIFAAADAARTLRDLGQEPGESSETAEGETLLARAVGIRTTARSKRAAAPHLIRGRFWVYCYVAADRLPAGHGREPQLGESAGAGAAPVLPLPPVEEKEIVEGQHYLVAEISFAAAVPGREVLTWQALVEPASGTVLYLRALSGDVNGLVYSQDPPTKTGNTALNSASTNATLSPHRDDLPLASLGPAVAGTQSLSGTYARVQNVEGEAIAPPTRPAGNDFDYAPRTNDFGAVSAYFHVDRLFRTIADLGFTVTGAAGMFRNTTFPIPVDHRCFAGATINAHCVGNGTGGIGHVGYGVMDAGDLANPLGRSADPRVTWHEVCGHGILYEAVNSANFRFSHSAGDSLSDIFFDPDTHLSGVDGTALGKPGDLRFTYVPWHPSLDRRSDRTTAAGWAWNGANDDRGYGSEEILETTLFRVYRSIGGDSPDLGRRRFASRMMLYLILRAVQSLTPATNPAYARDFAAVLMATDSLNWTSEGVYGGAYGKVIRWSFELQGEYQSPLVVRGGPGDGAVATRGLPPAQDVYIDDGRGGEYPFQPVHWHTTTVWNRRSPDGLTGHEEPEIGATNYAYVKVKNRGTQTATNVVVRGFHTKPGAGLLWPADFTAFTTPSISAGSIAGGNTQEKIVGPFEWTPNINAYGHDCMLMVVSADGDASNVDTFVAGESIPEWRLVPNDNNIAQRNVVPVPGGGGGEGLLAGLHRIPFQIGNPNPRRARIRVESVLPPLLVERGWRLELEGVTEGFVLASGRKRDVTILLTPGADFTREDVVAAGVSEVELRVYADDNLIGGMTYHLDPDLKRPHNGAVKPRRDCAGSARQLLDCLGVPDQRVGRAHIKEIVVGISIRDEGC